MACLSVQLVVLKGQLPEALGEGCLGLGSLAVIL